MAMPGGAGADWSRDVSTCVFCYPSIRSDAGSDNVRAMQWLAGVVLIATIMSCLTQGTLRADGAAITDHDLADARKVVEAVAASPKQTRLFCDWFRKQARMVEALSGGSRRQEEIWAITEASQAAYRKLGPAFARAHEISSLATFRKDELARSVNDAWSALTARCAGGSV
jgi:hypothetical protein